jgi:hypothetical protein
VARAECAANRRTYAAPLRCGLAPGVSPGIGVGVVADGAVEGRSGGGASAATVGYTSGRTLRGHVAKRRSIARDRRLAKPASPRIIDDPSPLPAPTSKGIVKTAANSKRRTALSSPRCRRAAVEQMPWALKILRCTEQLPTSPHHRRAISIASRVHLGMKLTCSTVACSSAST